MNGNTLMAIREIAAEVDEILVECSKGLSPEQQEELRLITELWLGIPLIHKPLNGRLN